MVHVVKKKKQKKNYVVLCCFCVISDDIPHVLDNIVKLKFRLSDMIEPDFGLLDHLLSLDVLTRREYDKVRAGDKAKYERSGAMLDLLVSEDQSKKLLKALQRTGQQHVVNFITQNGGQLCSLKVCKELLVYVCSVITRISM